MKVLVLGASGTIGNAVSLALVRAGHEVIGTTRSQSNINQFEKDEIAPLVIDATKDESWTNLIPSLDAVIDALGESNLSQSMGAVKAAEAAAKSRHPTSAKLTYIWTSGTWIQGNDDYMHKTDGAAISNPPELTKWRPQVEQALLKSPVLNGIVIRPSMVYGRNGSIFSILFEQASKGSISWAGNKMTRMGTIHCDDLAQCYRLAVEKAPIAAGIAFDCTNQSPESSLQLVTNLAELLKIPAEKVQLKDPEDAFETAITTTTILRPTLARSLLGWQPLKATLTDGLPHYYRAYLAYSQK